MNKGLLIIFVFIAILSVVLVISRDWIVGLSHFGWKSGDSILKSKLHEVEKIRFVNKSNFATIEFCESDVVNSILSQVHLKGIPSKTNSRGRYDLEFHNRDGSIVVINLGEEPIFEGFAFSYSDDFRKLFYKLQSELKKIKETDNV